MNYANDGNRVRWDPAAPNRFTGGKLFAAAELKGERESGEIDAAHRRSPPPPGRKEYGTKRKGPLQ